VDIGKVTNARREKPEGKNKVKYKFHPRRGHEGPEGE
jgi:hypothetical protein